MKVNILYIKQNILYIKQNILYINNEVIILYIDCKMSDWTEWGSDKKSK
jgi:hypothetical protein